LVEEPQALTTNEGKKNANIICFNCKEKSHIFSNCPKKLAAEGDGNGGDGKDGKDGGGKDRRVTLLISIRRSQKKVNPRSK